MQPLKHIPRLAPFLVWLLVATGTWLSAAAQFPAAPDKRPDAYRQNLNTLRQTWKGSRELPAIPFFLFGMGDRRKMIYKDQVAQVRVFQALGLEDPYTVPNVADHYSSLVWWGFKEGHVPGPRFDANAAKLYPYLVWAEDHFCGEKHGVPGDRDYPLSWEQQASDARYPGLAVLDPQYVSLKPSAPHTWYAAEMFLLLAETGEVRRETRTRSCLTSCVSHLMSKI